MRSKYLTIFILLVLFEFSHAQERNPDPTAKNYLTRMFEKFKEIPSYKIDFSIEINFPEQEPQTISGSYMTSDERFKLQMPNHTIFCNQESQWTVDHEYKEVQIMDYTPETENTELINPNNILNLYDREDLDYLITYDGPKEGRNVLEMDFKPLDRNSSFAKIKLAMDKDKLEPLSGLMINKDGSKYHLEINQIDTTWSGSKKELSFNPKEYTDYLVEDLRL